MQISCTVPEQLITTFVFTTWIVQSIYFLNPKFQASINSQFCGCTARFVSDLVRNTKERLSRDTAQFPLDMGQLLNRIINHYIQISLDDHQLQHLSLVVRKPVFGVSTRSDTNQAVQPHKMARGLKFVFRT